ncbi:MAG TPA: RluA family pseudouridine synthase [Thermoanaerobaculia bacterium]|nr:RluA family pseudouridine synthase [Thermoanaerobaculia bacterium]
MSAARLSWTVGSPSLPQAGAAGATGADGETDADRATGADGTIGAYGTTGAYGAGGGAGGAGAGVHASSGTPGSPPAGAGERLDRHVAAICGQPRNQVQQWIRAGLVRLNGRPAKPAEVVAAGDLVECEPPAPTPETLVPEPGEVSVLHEDDGMVVLDKPAGLTVHPGAGRATGTLVHLLLARYPEMSGVGGPGRPGIVHRLDKGTSGVMAVARSSAAYHRLSRAFAGRAVAKRYLAIVYGRPAGDAGVVDAPIGRHRERRREMTVRADGRPARTGYRVLAARSGISLLELDLATGRTHQIRVHLKSIGHPLVGDPVYGEARWHGLPRSAQVPLRDFPRPALHAWRLALPVPPAAAAGAAAASPGSQGSWQRFEAPVPEDLRRLWQAVAGEPFPRLPGWDSPG